MSQVHASSCSGSGSDETSREPSRSIPRTGSLSRTYAAAPLISATAMTTLRTMRRECMSASFSKVVDTQKAQDPVGVLCLLLCDLSLVPCDLSLSPLSRRPGRLTRGGTVVNLRQRERHDGVQVLVGHDHRLLLRVERQA